MIFPHVYLTPERLLKPTMPASQTEFLDSLEVAPASHKTRIVRELMSTKGYLDDQVHLLGFRRDGRSSFYYFVVPDVIVEIEIYWDTAKGNYARRFSDVFDNPRDIARMLGSH